MNKITIIGAGSWGTALARIINDNNYPVLLYDVDESVVSEINKNHINPKLPKIEISPKIKATSSLVEALAFGSIIVLVVPTAVARVVLKDISKLLKEQKLFVNASKGIEPNTYKRFSEILYEEIPESLIKGFVSLSGPSHAEEVINQMLTLVSSTSANLEDAKLIQEIFSNQHYFRVYTSTDLIGVEICSSLKNVIAIASGIITGLGYGDNTKAALITRGLIEMKRIALHFGGEEATVYGLAGLGDLIVTCTSTHSRNFQAGFKIGSGKDLNQALSEITMVVEGARTAVAAYQIIKEHNIYAPIIESIYDIIYNKIDPKVRILELMKNELKLENI